MSRQFKDPITGDELSLGEMAAWKATAFFRRWLVFFAIQGACVLWLTLGDTTARTWWNYVWSDLAVVVEGVTMLCLFAQGRRDAAVLRHVERISAHIEAILDHHTIPVPKEK